MLGFRFSIFFSSNKFVLDEFVVGIKINYMSGFASLTFASTLPFRKTTSIHKKLIQREELIGLCPIKFSQCGPLFQRRGLT